MSKLSPGALAQLLDGEEIYNLNLANIEAEFMKGIGENTSSNEGENSSTPKTHAPKPIEDKAPKSDKQELDFIQTGNSKVGIFIVINPVDTFDQPIKTFLNAILNAVKVNPNDVFILNPKGGETFAQIRKHHKAKRIILFNVTPFEIGIQNKNINLYELEDYERTLCLRGDKLKTISENVDKKRALWANLQRMFA